MRPLKGVIIRVEGQSLKIKLETGQTITTPRVHGLNTGKPVLVTYDFTKNKPKHVLPEEERVEEIEVKSEETNQVEFGDISDLDSGALRPSSDDGFWRVLVSGILEFSEPVFESSGCSDLSGVLELSVPSSEGPGGQDLQQ